MRFMMMAKADKSYEAGAPPDPRLMQAMAKWSEEQAKAGVLLLSEGLFPSSRGARLEVSGGRLSITDGPFAEARELIGGFAIVRVPSKAEAIEIGKQFLKLHQDILGPAWEGQCEIRQVFDPSDFAAGPPSSGSGR
jgi:hypothetical protein